VVYPDDGPESAEAALAVLDAAWGDVYDLGVTPDGRWVARRADGSGEAIVRATAAGLDAALRAGRMP
jgi:hypothetical protein